MEQKKYAVGLTLFNPIKEYIENIKRYAAVFDLVVVNDNTVGNDDRVFYVKELKQIENLVYLTTGENIGLPQAFNKILDVCYGNAIDYLCTLDQDSDLTDDAARKMKYNIEHSIEKAAIYAVSPVSKQQVSTEEPIGDYKEVEWVICSGSFLDLQILKQNNISYDDNYYIDRFDADLCMQIRRCGLKIIKYCNVTMYHECGTGGKHSAVRHYYMFRNRRYYNKKFYSWPTSSMRTFLQDCRHLWNIFLGRDDMLMKIKCYFYAKYDYANGRLGQINRATLGKIRGDIA